MPASRPRCLGGAISEMYIGATTVEMPIPRPPIDAREDEDCDVGAPGRSRPRPQNRERRSTAAWLCARSGPPANRRSASQPRCHKEPRPSRCHASPGSRPHSVCMVFSAPEMTTVSKPKRNPASAEVSDQKKMRAFIREKATYRNRCGSVCIPTLVTPWLGDSPFRASRGCRRPSKSRWCNPFSVNCRRRGRSEIRRRNRAQLPRSVRARALQYRVR